MKWTIIILAIALSLNGCADTADAETSSMATTESRIKQRFNDNNK